MREHLMALGRTALGRTALGRTALGVVVALSGTYAAGCSCDGPRTVPIADTGPPILRDAAPTDAPRRDGGSQLAITCAPVSEDDLFLLAADSVTTPPPVISFASTTTDIVVVWAETTERTGGARRVMYASFPAVGDPVPPTSLGDQTDGGMAPDIASVDGGFLVTWQRGPGPEVVVQRFDTALAPSGSPIVISSGAASLPRILAVSGGAVVGWVSGTQIVTRRVDASGNPSGAPSTLVDTGTTPSRFSLSELGAMGRIVAAWSPPLEDASRVRLHTLDAMGMPTGSAVDLGTELNAAGSIDVAGISRSADSMLEPLQGAAVFDADQLGFRDVRFRLLAADGSPDLAESIITEPGRSSWSPSLIPFGDGYLISLRAYIPDPGGMGTFPDPVLRIAYLDREGCRLGRSALEQNVATMRSDVGGAIAIDHIGANVLLGWTEIIPDGAGVPDVTHYRVARVECR